MRRPARRGSPPPAFERGRDEGVAVHVRSGSGTKSSPSWIVRRRAALKAKPGSRRAALQRSASRGIDGHPGIPAGPFTRGTPCGERLARPSGHRTGSCVPRSGRSRALPRDREGVPSNAPKPPRRSLFGRRSCARGPAHAGLDLRQDRGRSSLLGLSDVRKTVRAPAATLPIRALAVAVAAAAEHESR